MAIIAEWLNLEEKCVVPALAAAAEKLVDATGEVVLDFVSVRRIDANALRALEELAAEADKKDVDIVLLGVNVGLYKVLKLTKLARRFSYASGDGQPGTTKGDGQGGATKFHQAGVPVGTHEVEESHAEPSAE